MKHQKTNTTLCLALCLLVSTRSYSETTEHPEGPVDQFLTTVANHVHSAYDTAKKEADATLERIVGLIEDIHTNSQLIIAHKKNVHSASEFLQHIDTKALKHESLKTNAKAQARSKNIAELQKKFKEGSAKTIGNALDAMEKCIKACKDSSDKHLADVEKFVKNVAESGKLVTDKVRKTLEIEHGGKAVAEEATKAITPPAKAAAEPSKKPTEMTAPAKTTSEKK